MSEPISAQGKIVEQKTDFESASLNPTWAD